jgi:hypothetical protein
MIGPGVGIIQGLSGSEVRLVGCLCAVAGGLSSDLASLLPDKMSRRLACASSASGHIQHIILSSRKELYESLPVVGH